MTNSFNDMKIIYEEIQKKDPLKLYVAPTLVGLNNIGATIFMNPTLQCLSQTKDLTTFFLKQKNLEKADSNSISLNNKDKCRLYSCFLELIQNLWDNKNGGKSYSPFKFKEVINELTGKYLAHYDPKDFIQFILNQLHEELKISINSNNNSNLEPYNKYDKNNALNYFLKIFKNEVSIISDLFYGFYETTIQCLYCKTIDYNYQIFNFIIFPLEEVKNFKNNNNYQINISFQNNNNCVSIYDCFFYNQKPELLTGENQYYCNICKQIFKANYTSKIYMCPNILILILKKRRFEGYNVKLLFDEIINLTSFVLQKETMILYNFMVLFHVMIIVSISLLLVKVQLIINGIDMMILLLDQ